MSDKTENTKENLTDNRNYMIDTIRGILITLMVIAYMSTFFIQNGRFLKVAKYLWFSSDIILTIAIPLLFIISGFLFRENYLNIDKESSKKSQMNINWGRCFKRIFNLLYVYILTTIGYFIVHIIYGGFLPDMKFSDVVSMFRVSVGELWFLYILIIFHIAFTLYLGIIKLLSKAPGCSAIRLTFNIILYAALVCLAIFADLHVSDVEGSSFELYKFLRYAFLFFAGILISMYKDTFYKSNVQKTLSIISIPMFIAGLILLYKFGKAYIYTMIIDIPIFGIVTSVLLIPLIIFTIPYLSKFLSSRKTIAFIGKHSLEIYILNIIIVLFVYKLVSRFNLKGAVMILIPLLVFAASILIPALIGFILDKTNLRDVLLLPFTRADSLKTALIETGRVLTVILFIVACVFNISAIWLTRTWGELSTEEVIYHIVAPSEGTNSDVLTDYMKHYGIYEFILGAIIIAAIIFIYRTKKVRKVFYIILPIVTILLFGTFYLIMDNKMQVGDYIKSQMATEDFIGDNYVDPNSVNITFPEKKRNLIYIYLESMETSYTTTENGGALDHDCIPEIVELFREGDGFEGGTDKVNGGIPLYGSTYTAGAMFAHSSGLPLKIKLSGNDMNTQESIFPGITCIGDVLEKEGYENELLLGSKAVFGGRKTLYTTHGNYKMYDYDHVIEQGLLPSDYYVWWGYEDEKLYEYAKSELTRLSKEDKPFNLTMLTADSHFEDGYVCELCGNEFGDDQYSNVLACSSRQVYDFVRWIQNQDFYENTTIVISGDHCTMDKDFLDGIDKKYERKTISFVINSAAEDKSDKYREYSTMDLFPTTIAALGADIEGNKLGLGVNLYSNEETLIEKLGLDTADQKLAQKSEFMINSSNIDYNDAWLQKIHEHNKFNVTGVVDDTFNGQMIVSYKFGLKQNIHKLEDYKVMRMNVYSGDKLIATSDFKHTKLEDKYIRYVTDTYIDDYYYLNNENCRIEIEAIMGDKHFILYSDKLQNY